jgi:cbb3-type cytochrome oxidase subunit 3
MTDQGTAYFLFGLSLVIVLIAIIVYYYAKKRHDKIEEPKYKMFDDEN